MEPAPLFLRAKIRVTNALPVLEIVIQATATVRVIAVTPVTERSVLTPIATVSRWS